LVRGALGVGEGILRKDRMAATMNDRGAAGFTSGRIAADAAGALRGAADVPVDGFSIDTRTIRPGECFVAIPGPRFDGHDYVAEAARKGAAAAVVERDVEAPPEFPVLRVPRSVEALGRLASAHRDRLRGRVIAVTGSNGKTTTKGMIVHILGGRFRVSGAAKSYNNAIGVPLTLLGAGPEDACVVVEVGTNHPGEIASLGALVRPDVAVITNVGPSHLEGFGDEAGVAREKASLIEASRQDGVAILNADNPWTAAMALSARRRTVTFGLGAGAQVRAEAVERDARSVRFQVDGTAFRLDLLGIWNVANALAAVAACREAGLPVAESAARLRSFVPPPMRMEIREAGGIVWINDAYNANPASSLAAIEEYGRLRPPGRRLVVFGDMKELGGESAQYHRRVGEALAGIGIDCAVFVGAAARSAADRFRELAGGRAESREVSDAGAAAKALAGCLQPGDWVLLKGSRAMGLERIPAALGY
jgi:UDP-N-acetylmuramoyl-tripeptide--D-alanyl-D-alanine ligase